MSTEWPPIEQWFSEEMQAAGYRIRVFIRDNSTGEVAEFKCYGHPEEDSSGNLTQDTFDDYIWADGNYACDGNRAQFWYEAKGLECQEEHKCGVERYSIRITREDGAEVYRDDSWSE